MPALRHRADLGGVRLDVADEVELRADVAQVLALAAAQEPSRRDAPLEVQAMAPRGSACVVRTVEDPLFGPIVSFGLAGDASDLLGDVAYGVPPLTDVDVAELVRVRRAAAPRLFGYRGLPALDVAALEDVVARVAVLCDDLPELRSLELNPVVVAEQRRRRARRARRRRPRGPGRRAPDGCDGCEPARTRRRTPSRGGRMGACPLLPALRQDLHRAGYYPELVADVLDVALADEHVVAHLVHPETTFDAAEVRRHVTVLVLTPDAPGRRPRRRPPGRPRAPVGAARRRRPRPCRWRAALGRPDPRGAASPPSTCAGQPAQELTLAIGWGAVSRVDLEPATCGDPAATPTTASPGR